MVETTWNQNFLKWYSAESWGFVRRFSLNALGEVYCINNFCESGWIELFAFIILCNIVTPNPDMIQFDYQRTLTMEAENGGNAKVSLDIEKPGYR